MEVKKGSRYLTDGGKDGRVCVPVEVVVLDRVEGDSYMTAGKDWYVELGIVTIGNNPTIGDDGKEVISKFVARSMWIRENDLKVITELPE
jgi:hypothetical protein